MNGPIRWHCPEDHDGLSAPTYGIHSSRPSSSGPASTAAPANTSAPPSAPSCTRAASPPASRRRASSDRAETSPGSSPAPRGEPELAVRMLKLTSCHPFGPVRCLHNVAVARIRALTPCRRHPLGC